MQSLLSAQRIIAWRKRKLGAAIGTLEPGIVPRSKGRVGGKGGFAGIKAGLTPTREGKGAAAD